jgi:hypothetical protein
VDFGATCDGTVDDTAAVQAWADSIRDGGIGAFTGSAATQGCGIMTPIVLMPSTNTAPVQGPTIIGDMKLVALPGFRGDHMLQVYNPDAVTTSQNFYYPRFDALEFVNNSGTPQHCLGLRGFWGSIQRILGTRCNDVVQFPQHCIDIPTQCLPDVYESMPELGDITGLFHTGCVYHNLIGIGASPNMHNVRGTGNLTAGNGAVCASGSEKITGSIAYSGRGYAVVIDAPPAPATQTTPHEVFFEGNGDIDCAESGFYINTLEAAHITGHRMNLEPPGLCANDGKVWPAVAYNFGAAGGIIRNVTVDAYVTIRPGVTAQNIGSQFRFNSDPTIDNLTVNVWLSDQTGMWAGLPLAQRYSGIHPSAKLRIYENGVLVVQQ